MKITSARSLENGDWEIVLSYGENIVFRYEDYTFNEDLEPIGNVPESIADFVKKNRLPIITGEYPEYTQMQRKSANGMYLYNWRYTKKGWVTVADI